jgi:hypothetical protein
MRVGTKTGESGLFWEGTATRQPKVCLSDLSIFEGESDEDSGFAWEGHILWAVRIGRKDFVGSRIWRLQDFTGLNFVAT